MNQTCKQLAAPLMTILLVLCMCAAAELTGNQEILFPEIAAIAAGALLRKKAAWNTDGLHILGMIAAGAFAGVLIVRNPSSVTQRTISARDSSFVSESTETKRPKRSNAEAGNVPLSGVMTASTV